MTKLLQPILGTDKSNSFFTIYESLDDDNLDVYFGLALLEVVKKRKNNFHYKHLLGRLYNAGFKRKKLVSTFKHPLSTLIRWGTAVKSGDIKEMTRAFSGQGACKKITTAIDKYVRKEFNRIYSSNKYSYSKEIITNVKDIFGVEFKSESLRNIFNEEKLKIKSNNSNNNLIDSPICKEENLSTMKNALKNSDLDIVNIEEKISNTCNSSPNTGTDTANNRKHSLSKG